MTTNAFVAGLWYTVSIFDRSKAIPSGLDRLSMTCVSGRLKHMS